MRFDAVWVRVHGCIGQGLQSTVRFPRGEGTCEQHQVVCGPTYPLEEPNGFASGTKHESGIGSTISRAWSGAEIMPPKNTGVRPARSWQQAVVLRDNGTMAVADVQFCHGSAHSLLHHFLAGQNRGQFEAPKDLVAWISRLDAMIPALLALCKADVARTS